ncbi:MAG: hypothetical protein FJX68_10060 [Alphaproteobacteria bacterium]|nr:hypothetical protein [Alphaproteobacteria bacterium]
MAMRVMLRHPGSGLVRPGFIGFSWTSLFFGGFPALLRGDLLVGLAVIAVSILLGAFSFGLAWFAVNGVWAFLYNNNYSRRLLEQGYELADEPGIVAEAKQRLGVF